MIRDASDNRSSLDDVMRELYNVDLQERPRLHVRRVVERGEQRGEREIVRRFLRALHRRPRAVSRGMQFCRWPGMRLARDTINEPRVGIGTCRTRAAST